MTTSPSRAEQELAKVLAGGEVSVFGHTFALEDGEIVIHDWITPDQEARSYSVSYTHALNLLEYWLKQG